MKRPRLVHTGHSPSLDRIEQLAAESKQLADEITRTVALLRNEADDDTGADGDRDT